MKVVLRSSVAIISISLFLVFLPTTMFAQAPEIQWTNTYRLSSESYENDQGNSVKQTTDGGFIIAGDGGITNSELGVLPYGRVILIKTDSNGDTVWTKDIGGGRSRGNSVLQTVDEGYIITGRTWTSIGPELWLVKTNINGDTLWTKTMGSGSGHSIQHTNDGGYIVTGSKNDDVWLIKTDIKGDTLWTKTFGEIGLFDCGYSVEQTSDSGYVLTGITKERPLNGGGSRSMLLLITTNAVGDTLWTRAFDGEIGGNWGTSVFPTTDGGYIVTGVKNNNSPGLTTDSNLWLIKTNMQGDTLWTKTFGRFNEFDFGNSVQQTNDGGYIFTGNGSLGFIKTDGSGDTLWTKTFEGVGNSVQQTSDGGYIVAGSRNGDVLLIKIAPDITSIDENPSDSVNDHKLQQNYPNPFNPETSIEFSLLHSDFVKLNIYNILGEEIATLVSETLNAGDHAYTWDATGYASGVYYYKLVAGNFIQTRKMIYLK